MALLFIPLTTITNDPIPKEEMGNATSIFNLMRNIGASIGIASVTTIITRHQQIHTNELGQHINPFSAQSQQTLEGMKQVLMSRGADALTAQKQAYAALFGMVQQQAAMMSFNDAFLIMSIMFLAVSPLVLLMKRPTHAADASAAMH